MNLELLQQRFDENSFLNFLKSTFDDFEQLDTRFNNTLLSDDDTKHIKTYKKLGEAWLSDDSEIGFLILQSSNKNIINKRVGFSKVISKLAKDFGSEVVLVAIYHEESEVWRLTLVSFDFKNGKQIQNTHSKRYTYELGENIAIKTAQAQIGLLTDSTKITQTLLEEVFSVERVTKEFFNQYKILYFDTLHYLLPQVAKFGGEKELELFTKKLLGRIVFLYFLQKKGWLGAKESWEDGDKKFLTNCFYPTDDNGYPKYSSFYDDILKPIFFEALNTDRTKAKYIFKSFGKMPYLNGGLFNESDVDRVDIIIEDEIFKKIIDTFDQYNFTIVEDTPHDSEVAIDPEMLGRIFEDLLEDRKEKGAFYTPREIVHYMCQQSIIDYLANSIDNKEALRELVIHKRLDESLETSQLIELLKNIKVLDPAIGSGAFPMGMLHEIVTLLELLTDQHGASLKRSVIENSIYGVDIEPSAVEIAKLRFWLSIVVDETKPHPLPNLFYKIMVGNSLLETINGLDLLQKQEKKISKSKLRQIENQTVDDINFLLQKKLHEYFNEHDKDKKKFLNDNIKKHIIDILDKSYKGLDVTQSLLNETKKEIKQREENLDKKNLLEMIIKDYQNHNYSTELFLYHIYFKDVIDRGGFDVVIGNPPYVRHEKIKAIKERLKIEGYQSYNGTADLYIYFFEQGYRLLKENGILSYITSNKYTRAKYGKEFREFVLNNTTILEYIDFNGVKVFESATVDTSILSFRKWDFSPTKSSGVKTPPPNNFIYCDINATYKKGNDLGKFIDKNGFGYAQSDLSLDSFTFANPKELKVKKQMEQASCVTIRKLIEDNTINMFRGISTGINRAFVLDADEAIKLISEDERNKNSIKKLAKGRGLQKYYYEASNEYILYIPWTFEIEKNPSIAKHLEQFESDMRVRPEVNDGRYPWYAMSRYNSNSAEEFDKEKIVWQRVTQEPTFSLVDSETYILDSLAFITCNEISLKYLLGILNSKAMAFYIDSISHQYSNTGYLLSNQYVERLPIPKIPQSDQKPFEILVDYILFAKAQGLNLEASYFESVIDGLVYDLYFEEEMKKAKCYISDEVKDTVQPWTKSTSTDTKKKFITLAYKACKESKVIERGLIYSRTIAEIRTINEQ